MYASDCLLLKKYFAAITLTAKLIFLHAMIMEKFNIQDWSHIIVKVSESHNS